MIYLELKYNSFISDSIKVKIFGEVFRDNGYLNVSERYEVTRYYSDTYSETDVCRTVCQVT